MSSPVISVIIPVYNAGKFLDPCFESVQAQTFSDFEVILVDNGSTDGSGQRCDQWAQKDSRFQVVHQNNQGIIGGRSTGISRSRGEYLAFVDSDDLIHPQMLELLLASCQRSKLLCAGCLLLPFFGQCPPFERIDRPSETRFEAPRHLDALLHCSSIVYSLCNKLYHRSLFEKVSLRSDIMYNEDLFTNWSVLQHAPGFVLVDFTGYYYRQHGTSLSHRAPDDKFFSDQIFVAEFMRDSSRGTSMENSAWAFYYEKLLYLNSMILRRKNAADYKNWHQILMQPLRAQLSAALRCRELSPLMKLTALLTCWGGGLYRILCRLILTDRR